MEEKTDQGASWDFRKESRIISLPGEFWIAPITFKGVLWWLSRAGSLLCLSPYDSRPTGFADFGAEYGNSPGIIHEIGPRKVPHFLAAAPNGIKGVNLLNAGVVEYIRAGSGEEILETYATVAVEGGSFFFLLRRAGKIFLAIGGFDQGLVRNYELPGAERYVGPVKVGKCVAAYSRERIYLLEGERLYASPFRDGFSAWDTLGIVEDLSSPPGHLPYVSAADSLYIPGHLNNALALLRVTNYGTLDSYLRVVKQR